MRVKVMGILFVMLLILSVPICQGAFVEEAEEVEKPLFGWTIIRGLIGNMVKMGNDLYFRAIRLHYTEITGMEMSIGVIKLKRCRVSDLGPDRHLTFGPLGSLTWIVAICHGGLQEL
jgi:hypothetical protein